MTPAERIRQLADEMPPPTPDEIETFARTFVALMADQDAAA